MALLCMHYVALNSGIQDPDLNAKLARTYNVTPPFGLEDFTYTNSDLLDIVFQHMTNTSFSGVTVSQFPY